MRTDVKYARIIFEHNAGQIGDLRDPILVRQLSGFYTMLDRLESFGSARPLTFGLEYLSRFMASLGSTLYLATLLEMRLIAQTKGFVLVDLKLSVTEQDAQDQQLAKVTLEKYGDPIERRVLEENA